MSTMRSFADYTRPDEARRTVAALAALADAALLAQNVERLVRESRRMLQAFEEGRVESYASSSMMEALAPFEGMEV